MKSELIEYNNIFDVLLKIYDNIKKKNSDIMNAYQDRQENFIFIMKNYLSFFYDINCHQLFDNNKEKLMDKISEMKDIDGELYEIALIMAINNYFGNYNDAYKFGFEDETDGELVIQCNALNSEKTFQLGKVYYRSEESIFAKILSKYDYPRATEQSSPSIDNFIDKLIIMRELESETKIQYNRLISEITLDRIKGLKQSLNVALVPFVGDIEYLNVKEEGKKFTINIQNSENNFMHLIKILEELNSRDVHVVVFPEMTFTTELQKQLQKYLVENKTSFELIVSGSMWEEKTNKCFLYNNKGRKLIEQIKIHPYLKKKDPKLQLDGNIEGILVKSDDAIINIIDIEGFGRLAIPICVDFINEEYYTKLALGGVNVTLNPVCTSSLMAFNTFAKQLGSKNRATIFISNTCIHRKSNNIGFVYLPIKLSNELGPIRQSNLNYERKKNCEICNTECLSKVCAKIIKFGNECCVTEEIII